MDMVTQDARCAAGRSGGVADVVQVLLEFGDWDQLEPLESRHDSFFRSGPCSADFDRQP